MFECRSLQITWVLSLELSVPEIGDLFLVDRSGCVCVCAQSLSHVWLFATTWTVARQAPLFLEFPRQEYWNGLRFPFLDPGIKLVSPASPLAGGFFATVSPGNPWIEGRGLLNLVLGETGAGRKGWWVQELSWTFTQAGLLWRSWVILASSTLVPFRDFSKLFCLSVFLFCEMGAATGTHSTFLRVVGFTS